MGEQPCKATEEDNAASLMRLNKLGSDGRGRGPPLSVDLERGIGGDKGGKVGLEGSYSWNAK